MWKPVILQSTQWILLLIIMLFFREVTSWYMWKLQFKIYLSLSHLKLFLKLLPLHDPTACATNIATICTLLLLISDMFYYNYYPYFYNLSFLLLLLILLLHLILNYTTPASMTTIATTITTSSHLVFLCLHPPKIWGSKVIEVNFWNDRIYM